MTSDQKVCGPCTHGFGYRNGIALSDRTCPICRMERAEAACARLLGALIVLHQACSDDHGMGKYEPECAICQAMRGIEGASLLSADAQHIGTPGGPLSRGCLEVCTTPDGREVVVNHPDLQPDNNGCGHIVFSPAQARAFAATLIKHAEACSP